MSRMSAGEQVEMVVTALGNVFSTVDPWLAALWLATTLLLAFALVYGWQRLLRR